MRKKISVSIGCTLIAAAALLMSIMGIRFLYDSPFQWSFMQPEYRNAVLEMMLMAWIYFGVLSIRHMKDRTRYSLVAILFLIQTFLRSYFWAVMANALYFFTLGMTGYLICTKVLRHDDAEFELHKYILFGMSFEIILVALMSVFSVAYPATLRYVLLGICLIECVLLRKELLRGVRGFFHPQHELTETNHSVFENIALTICLTGITLIACRANQGFDYDSMWYGLQSEYVLVPNGSIYTSPDLISIVFTYAKGFEVISLPFAGMTSYSFITACNLILMAMTLHCIYQICREMGLKLHGMAAACFVALTPSVMVMVMTAKSDVITLYLTMVAVYYAVRAFREKNALRLGISIAALILSYGMKPTSLAFSSVILVCIFINAILSRVGIRRKAIVSLFIPFIALSALVLRTIIKTGLPFNSMVVSLFSQFGIQPQYPYILNAARVTSMSDLFSDFSFLWERITRLLDIFFYPVTNELPTTMITWWGSLISFVWLLSLILPIFCLKKIVRKCKEDPSFLFLTITHYLISACSVGSMLLLDCPDGNYFAIAQTLSCIYFLHVMTLFGGTMKRGVAWGLVPLMLVNLMLECCISPAWSLGLTPISWTNMGYYNDYENRYQSCLEYHHADDLFDYLMQEKHYAIICASTESTLRFLPTAVDSYDAIYNWGAEHLQDANSFLKYISFAKIDGILIDSQESIPSPFYTILLELAEEGYLFNEYENDRYMLMGVNCDPREVDEEAVSYLQKRLGIYEGTFTFNDCSYGTGASENGWMESNATLTIPTSKNGQIQLNIYIPFDLPENACITVSVDGEYYKDFPVANGSFTLEIQAEPYTEKTIGFTSNFEFNNPPDVRMLSFLITSLKSY